MKRRIPVVVLLIVVAVAAVVGARLFGAEERDVTTSSDEAYAAYEKGMNALGRFRLEEADSSFARAIEIDPDFAMAHMRRAQVALSMDQRKEAERHIEAAHETREHVSELERLWIERNQAAVGGDREKAEEIYQELLAKYGDHPWVLRLRAEFDKMNGRYEEALAAYDRILEQDPEAVDIHNLQGYLYLSMGEYEKAVQSLQRYAFYAPEQANPHDSLGEAFLYTGRYEDAIGEFVRALEIDPSFVWSAVHLSETLSVIGQFDKARQVLDKVAPVFEDRSWGDWLAMQRMRVDYRAENWPELLRAVEAKLAARAQDDAPSEPSDYDLWLRYAQVMSHLEMGDVETAREVLPELVTVADAFLDKRGQYATPRQIARLNEALVKARFARAEGDPAAGIDELRAAIDESDLSPHELSYFRYELAESLLAADRPGEAVEVTNQHLDVIPTSPMLNLVAAKAHARLGEREEALEHLRTYLEVMRSADEGHPRVAEATRMLQRLVPRS